MKISTMFLYIISVLYLRTHGICLICPASQIKHPFHVITPYGETCSDVMIDVALQISSETNECNDMIALYSPCCNSKDPPIIPQLTDTRPSQGTEDICYICGQGNIIGSPDSMVYVPTMQGYTCSELETMGTTRFIPFYLCHTAKQFASKKCQCFNCSHAP